MTVSIHCPNCQHQARCGADKIGKQVRCPSCSEVFTISVPGASVRAAAEARRRRADPAPERTRRPGAHANRTPRRSNKRGRSSVGTAVAIVAVLLACGSGLAYALSAGNADTNLAPRLPAQASGQLGLTQPVITHDTPGRRANTPAPNASSVAPASVAAAVPTKRATPGRTPSSTGAAPTLGGSPDASPGRTSVTRFLIGGPGDDSVDCVIATENGDLLIAGVVAAAGNLPQAASMHQPLGPLDGTDLPFLARISGDLQTLHWVSALPGGSLKAQQLALGPDGAIFLGGSRGKNLHDLAAKAGRQVDANWDRSSIAIVKFASDGSQVDWISPGGPNQKNSKVTGLVVDEQGRASFLAHPDGRGKAAYCLRLQPNGDHFADWDTAGWAISLHHKEKQLLEPGQFGAFYQTVNHTDLDGPEGWREIHFKLYSIRQTGQVLLLDDGGVVLAGTLAYDFKEEGKKWFPAFDYFLARYDATGKLLWSTNLYADGDSVHTPDQKPQCLSIDTATGDLLVGVKQHGSNQYRLAGELKGDTGNMLISWIGRVDLATGALKHGWYWHVQKYPGSVKYDQRGMPTHGWPSLAGNRMTGLANDAEGRVWFAGGAPHESYTSADAYAPWPADRRDGQPYLAALDPSFKGMVYATTFAGTSGGGAAEALAMLDTGIALAGRFTGTGFSDGTVPSFGHADSQDQDGCLILARWP